MAKLTAQKLVDMDDDEFESLISKVQPKLERIIMSPPRTPRGEKPAVTIRYLKRQIANLQASCAMYHRSIEDKTKVIAGYDVQLSETDDEIKRLQNLVSGQAMALGDAHRDLRRSSERLAYLEGYHAKSQETIQPIRPIPTQSSSIAGDQSETHPPRSPRDQENLPPRRQGGQSPGIDQGPAGFGPRFGDPLRRQHPHDLSNPQERQVEHIEINDGISRERFSLRNRGD